MGLMNDLVAKLTKRVYGLVDAPGELHGRATHWFWSRVFKASVCGASTTCW